MVLRQGSATAGFSATSLRTRPTSSCSSPARRGPKSSRRRSATFTSRSIRISRISATSCCAAIGGTGYIRVDWFTPDGLATWGDGRLTILGTEGFIEIRKNVDIAGRPAGATCSWSIRRRRATSIAPSQTLPYGEQLVSMTCSNRTETAMPQAHCFLAMELVLQAQQQAQRCDRSLGPGRRSEGGMTECKRRRNQRAADVR